MDATTSCSICGTDKTDICQQKLCEGCCLDAQEADNVSQCSVHVPSEGDDDDGAGRDATDAWARVAQRRQEAMDKLEELCPGYRFLTVTSPYLAFDVKSLVRYEIMRGTGSAFDLVQRKVEVWQARFGHTPENDEVEAWLEQIGKILEEPVSVTAVPRQLRLLETPLHRICALIHIRGKKGKAGARAFTARVKAEEAVPEGLKDALEAADTAQRRAAWRRRQRDQDAGDGNDGRDGGGGAAGEDGRQGRGRQQRASRWRQRFRGDGDKQKDTVPAKAPTKGDATATAAAAGTTTG